MTDPVAAADGSVYERSAIEAWFKTPRCGQRSPITNAQLPTTTVHPVPPLRRAIEEYGHLRPGAVSKHLDSAALQEVVLMVASDLEFKGQMHESRREATERLKISFEERLGRLQAEMADLMVLVEAVGESEDTPLPVLAPRISDPAGSPLTAGSASPSALTAGSASPLVGGGQSPPPAQTEAAPGFLTSVRSFFEQLVPEAPGAQPPTSLGITPEDSFPFSQAPSSPVPSTDAVARGSKDGSKSSQAPCPAVPPTDSTAIAAGSQDSSMSSQAPSPAVPSDSPAVATTAAASPAPVASLPPVPVAAGSPAQATLPAQDVPKSAPAPAPSSTATSSQAAAAAAAVPRAPAPAVPKAPPAPRFVPSYDKGHVERVQHIMNAMNGKRSHQIGSHVEALFGLFCTAGGLDIVAAEAFCTLVETRADSHMVVLESPSFVSFFVALEQGPPPKTDFAVRALTCMFPNSGVKAGPWIPFALYLLECGEETAREAAEKGMKRLGNCRSSNAALNIEDQDVARLVALLRSSPLSVQAAAVLGIQFVAKHAGGEEQVAANGAIPALVGVFRASQPSVFRTYTPIKKEVIRTLDHLSQVEQLQQAVVDAGAVPLMAQLLQGAKEPVLKEASAHMLATLMMNDRNHVNAAGQAAVVASGAVPLLVDLLKHGRDDGQVAAARALGNLAMGREHRGLVGGSGALPALLALAQCRDPQVRDQCKTCLRHLLEDAGAMSSMPCAESLPAVLSLLPTAELAFRNSAAEFLEGLAFQTSGQRHLVQAGAIHTLVTMLEEQPFRAARAASSLKFLAHRNQKFLRMVARANAVPALARLFRQGRGQDCTEEACKALRCLAVDEPLQKSIEEALGCPLPADFTCDLSQEERDWIMFRPCDRLAAPRDAPHALPEMWTPPYLQLLSQRRSSA